jgi:spermidine synthase
MLSCSFEESPSHGGGVQFIFLPIPITEAKYHPCKGPYDMKSRSVPIYVLFFLSGACGLIYQVIWARLFGLVFGNTIYASSTVLAAFMGGLALGSAWGGTPRAQRYNGLKLYAFLELCVGVLGGCMPLFVHQSSSIYTWIYQAMAPSFGALTVVRFIISFAVLMVPASFMGATLPVISAFVSSNTNGYERVIGKLYGLNTLGAFIGCYTAGFVLIGNCGLTFAGCVAASLNAAVAITAFFLGRACDRKEKRSELREPAGTGDRLLKETASNTPVLRSAMLLTVMAMTGFASLALEVAWLKALTWIMGMDVYAFASMLSVILAGIGLGSIVYSLYIKKKGIAEQGLAILQFCAGASVLASIWAMSVAYDLSASITKGQDAANFIKPMMESIGVAVTNNILAIVKAGLVMFIPSLVMGISFPAVANRYIGIKRDVGPGMARAYSVNTLGAILGSIGMGFFILPAVGLLPSIALMGGIFFFNGFVLLYAAEKMSAKRKVIAMGALAATSVAIIVATPLDFKTIVEKTLRTDPTRADEELVYFKEGATGDVLVKKSAAYGREMFINGPQVASTGAQDLHSHLYPAHCVALMKDTLNDVCIIAFGCGGTAGSFLLYPEVKRLDAVEICSGVTEPAKRYFSDMNGNVFSDPRFHLIFQDGKNYIRMTGKRYDVIYSGPIHPQANQGSAGLYTKEYFSDCKNKLKMGGMQCLWLPLHMASADDFKIIVKTFLDVYPYAALFLLPNTPTSVKHAHLIGSDEPLALDYARIAERVRRPAVAADLERLGESGFSEPLEFASQLVMDDTELREWTRDVTKTNTDDLPVVEFYNRDFTNTFSETKSKVQLLTEITRSMKPPVINCAGLPDERRDSISAEVARAIEGEKCLILGHVAEEFLSVIPAENQNYQTMSYRMDVNYRKAFMLMPQNRFLKNYCSKGQQ